MPSTPFRLFQQQIIFSLSTYQHILFKIVDIFQARAAKGFFALEKIEKYSSEGF